MESNIFTTIGKIIFILYLADGSLKITVFVIKTNIVMKSEFINFKTLIFLQNVVNYNCCEKVLYK